MATLTSASDYLENAWLDHALNGATYTPPSNVYVALFTAAPSDAGGGTEVGTRQAASFDSASGREATTDADITFESVPAGSVTHVGIFDDDTSGNLLFWGEVDDAVDPDGDDLVIASGTLTVAVADAFWTDYLAHAFLDHVLSSASYSPATTVEMALLDDAGAEFTGGTYARQAVSFGAAASGSAANDTAYAFTGLPAATWEAGRLHEDISSGGEALIEWPVTPKALTAGSSLTFAIGSTVAGLD